MKIKEIIKAYIDRPCGFMDNNIRNINVFNFFFERLMIAFYKENDCDTNCSMLHPILYLKCRKCHNKNAKFFREHFKKFRIVK